jgi:hypothetical protein
MTMIVAESRPPTPSPTPPPPGIIPWTVITPWTIIGVRVGIVVIFPKVDLLAQKKRVSVIHVAQRFHLLAKDFACHCKLFAFSVKIGI